MRGAPDRRLGVFGVEGLQIFYRLSAKPPDREGVRPPWR